MKNCAVGQQRTKKKERVSPLDHHEDDERACAPHRFAAICRWATMECAVGQLRSKEGEGFPPPCHREDDMDTIRLIQREEVYSGWGSALPVALAASMAFLASSWKGCPVRRSGNRPS